MENIDPIQYGRLIAQVESMDTDIDKAAFKHWKSQNVG